MSEGVGSSSRRVPHWSSTRFQYVPYALRVPSLTAAETTGMYSAKVEAGPLAAGADSRSGGARPSPSSRSSAASTTACPGASVRASGPVTVIGLLLHGRGTGYGRQGPG